ncbi:MAG: GNAT family N-acetyltransferase [Deltaproteobacteria bacterium]|nr:GNAT family N-acetyltransferase [Deltaproteobacteria bacterium]
MKTTASWVDRYVGKKKTAEEAVSLIKPGQRVFFGSYCGEPQHLVRHFFLQALKFTDVEVVRLMAMESSPLTLIAHQTNDQNLNIRSFYSGSLMSKRLARDMRFITPVNLFAIPPLFKHRKLYIHAAFIQVTPPDDFGWMSLGVSVDITQAAALSADLVIAQVNSAMPRVMGDSFIHVNDVDVIVEHEEPLISIQKSADSEAARKIARQVAMLVEDGSTIQTGIGPVCRMVLAALGDKNDLGVHSQFISDEIMHLVSKGVITNKFKEFNEGKIVASSAVGTGILYDFLDDNPSIEFHPSDYVNSPALILRNRKMVSMNNVMIMDLTGQVATDALASSHYSGVNGSLDFMRGATLAKGGKSILMLTSTSADEKKTHIVPMLKETAIVVPRVDVHYVVTEYGAVNLHGKSLQERAMAMISLAHPNFRNELFLKAREIGLLGKDRVLSESIHGIYPLKIEETRKVDAEKITIRPAKPVDIRRIQEHYYNMDSGDIYSRFMHAKSRFIRNEIEQKSQIDYVNNLTIVVVTGEFGFGKIIGVGEYLLEKAGNTAEIAFSINRKWQGKGLGRVLISKLSKAAMENGIANLIAYTSPQNRKMIELFKTLPYKITSIYEDGFVVLRCSFEENE